MNKADDTCQCYLIVPTDISADVLDAFARDGSLARAACVLLRADDAGLADRSLTEAVLQLAHAADIPLVLEHDCAAAAELGADGVHIAGNEEAYARARELLGVDAIVGADCGMSRHAAMTLGELGADYVAFSASDTDALRDIVVWWSEVTVVPCVAWDIPDLETVGRMAQAGADFVAVGTPVWSHPGGARAGMRELADKLATDRAAA